MSIGGANPEALLLDKLEAVSNKPERIKPGFLAYDEVETISKESFDKMRKHVDGHSVKDFWQVPVGARFPTLLQKAWDFIPTVTISVRLPTELLNPFRLAHLDDGRGLLRHILSHHLRGFVPTTRAVAKSTTLESQRVMFKAGRQLGKTGGLR